MPLGTDLVSAWISPEPRGALGTGAGQEGQDRLPELLPPPVGPQNFQGGGAMPTDPWDDQQLLGEVCNTHPCTGRAVGNPLPPHHQHPARGKRFHLVHVGGKKKGRVTHAFLSSTTEETLRGGLEQSLAAPVN